MKVCSNCSNEIPDDAVFCQHCGHKQEAQAPDSSAQDVSVNPTQEPIAQPIGTKKSQIPTGILLGIFGTLFICIIAGALLLQNGNSSSGGSSNFSNYSPSSSSNNYHIVAYEISGSGGANRASLTWSNEQGGTEQEDSNLPFRKTLDFTDENFVYVSAQNDGDHGSVTCKIYVDGNEFKTSTSSGAYAIATCSGSLR